MSISSINCTPIKPQVSFGKEYSVNDANKITQLSQELSDSFRKEGQDENKKSPIQTTVSVLGAAAAMFALGATAAQGGIKLVKKIPQGTRQKAVSTAVKAKEAVKGQLLKIKLPQNEKLAKAYTKTVGKAYNFVVPKAKALVEKNGIEKVVTVSAGALAAAKLAPAIIKADGNKDGVADITQRNINAYASALKSAEIFSDIVGVLA